MCRGRFLVGGSVGRQGFTLLRFADLCPLLLVVCGGSGGLDRHSLRLGLRLGEKTRQLLRFRAGVQGPKIYFPGLSEVGARLTVFFRLPLRSGFLRRRLIFFPHVTTHPESRHLLRGCCFLRRKVLRNNGPAVSASQFLYSVDFWAYCSPLHQ